jgi:heme exporter protein B
MRSRSSRILSVLVYELRNEFRNRDSLSGIVVYALASIFITWLCFLQSPDAQAWTGLFWIILLFAATNASARSFIRESRGLQLFHFMLFRPGEIILAKSLFNFVLLSFLGMLNLICFLLMFGSPVDAYFDLCLLTLSGAFGLASVLTLVSSIVSKAHGNASLTAVLGFPLLFPMLLILVRSTLTVFNGTGSPDWFVLMAFDGLILTLSYILFPYLWRE